MKRGLKVKSKQRLSLPSTVTTVSPMKRGLKENAVHPHRTGRAILFKLQPFPPMKRGLKDISEGDLALATAGLMGYNRFPDEKGTESFSRVERFRAIL